MVLGTALPGHHESCLNRNLNLTTAGTAVRAKTEAEMIETKRNQNEKKKN